MNTESMVFAFSDSKNKRKTDWDKSKSKISIPGKGNWHSPKLNSLTKPTYVLNLGRETGLKQKLSYIEWEVTGITD